MFESMEFGVDTASTDLTKNHSLTGKPDPPVLIHSIVLGNLQIDQMIRGWKLRK